MFSWIRAAGYKSRCSGKLLPEDICGYLEKNKPFLRKDLKLEEIRFVVLDTETTGLDVNKDSLLSIGAIGVKALMADAADSFEGVIRNDKEAVRETVHIHGILPSESARGLPEEEMLRAFLTYLENSVIVAHNAAFDRSMIDKSLRRLWNIRLENYVLDTMDLARRFNRDGMGSGEIKPGRYSLDTLADEYGIDVHDRHTAWGDAMITAKLLLVLLKKAEKRGVKTLKSLRRNPGQM